MQHLNELQNKYVMTPIDTASNSWFYCYFLHALMLWSTLINWAFLGNTEITKKHESFFEKQNLGSII